MYGDWKSEAPMRHTNGSSGSFELLVMDKLMGISHSLGHIEGQVEAIPEMKEQISEIKAELANLPVRYGPSLLTFETIQKHCMWALPVALLLYNLFALASGKQPVTPPAQISMPQ